MGIVLFGQVEAAASETQRSAAQVQLDQLEMILTFSPVATQPVVQTSLQ